MPFSTPPKRKNDAGLSPEMKEWLNVIGMILILPGTILVIGLVIWLSMTF